MYNSCYYNLLKIFAIGTISQNENDNRDVKHVIKIILVDLAETSDGDIVWISGVMAGTKDKATKFRILLLSLAVNWQVCRLDTHPEESVKHHDWYNGNLKTVKGKSQSW